MLFHGWNVSELDAMALPPCHLLYQYHVTSSGRLDCLLFQSSADLLLGAPFNFVGASALLLTPGRPGGPEAWRAWWIGGDVHLYSNHVAQAREQLSREPLAWPTMRLTRRPDDIDSYRIDDFEVRDYAPHAPIPADVAV